MTRGFSYLIGASFEGLAILVGGVFLAGWLDKNYPISVKWITVVLPVSLIVVAHTFYVVIRAILRLEAEGKHKSGAEADDV